MTAGSPQFSLQELVQRGLLWRAGKGETGNPEQERKLGLPFRGRLPFGSIHEWCLETELHCKARRIWYPPSFLLCAVLGEIIRAESERVSEKRLLAWTGRRIWPTPEVLRLIPGEMPKMFLKPETKDDRLWTIIRLLRSPAIFGVVADGSGLNLIATRRIQLAARTNDALCFLLRPPWEIGNVSTAQTKWKVTPVPTGKDEMYERWNIELLRGKGLPCPLDWQLEWREQNNQGALALVEKLSEERAGVGVGTEAEAGGKQKRA